MSGVASKNEVPAMLSGGPSCFFAVRSDDFPKRRTKRQSKFWSGALITLICVAIFASPAMAQGAAYALSVSTSSNHSNGVLLQGATLSGNVYIFTSSAANPQNFNLSGISGVCY